MKKFEAENDLETCMDDLDKAMIDRTGHNMDEAVEAMKKDGVGGSLSQEELDKCFADLKQELCKDAISRQAVLDYIDNMPSTLTADGRRMIRRRTLEEYISDTLPPVNPQEPKKGRWIFYNVHGHNACKCSECNGDIAYCERIRFKFCPFCGTDMRGDTDANRD